MHAGHSSSSSSSVSAREFYFTFVVTNDNRGDTFPETPFHVRLLASNDQAPVFVQSSATLLVPERGSLIVPRDLFDIHDPDTGIERIVFAVERVPTRLALELRARSQRYLLAKGDRFTIHEIRDGTFRLIHNGQQSDESSSSSSSSDDELVLAVSDNKHTAYKSVRIRVHALDKLAPRVAADSSMLLDVDEAEVRTLEREHMSFVDDKSPPAHIVVKVSPAASSQQAMSGRLLLASADKGKDKDKGVATVASVFTQADIDAGRVRYEAPREIGHVPLVDVVRVEVSDRDGNRADELHTFTIRVRPVDNQPPLLVQPPEQQQQQQRPYRVSEGGVLVLSSESAWHISDVDSSDERLVVLITRTPKFGHIEHTTTSSSSSSSSSSSTHQHGGGEGEG